MDKLGIEGIIDRTVSIVRGSNADHGVGMNFRAIMLGVISGSRHLSDVVRLGSVFYSPAKSGLSPTIYRSPAKLESGVSHSRNRRFLYP